MTPSFRAGTRLTVTSSPRVSPWIPCEPWIVHGDLWISKGSRKHPNICRIQICILQGLYRGSVGEEIKRCFSVFLFNCTLLLGFSWFVIGSKWLIQAWGGVQYYVWHFWTFPNSDQFWDFGPLSYCRNIPNASRTNPESFF